MSPRIQDRPLFLDRNVRRLDEAGLGLPALEGRRPADALADAAPAPAFEPSTGGATSRRGDRALAEAHVRGKVGRTKPERFQVGTYNIGNANQYARRPENFAKTREFLGEKAARGEVDVMLLQEVDRGTRRAQGKDNNVEMLKSVFEGELGPRWKNASMRERRVDGNTIEVVARNRDGDVRKMRIDIGRYDEKGERTKERPAPVIRYEATVLGDKGKADDRTYNLIYGASKPVPGGGQYGNAVLMGPGFEPERFAMRTAGRDPSDGERRTALAVELKTPGGQSMGVVSTHLTNGPGRAEQGARADQYRAVDAFADRFFGDGTPNIVGGDFNSRATRPGALGWRDPDRGRGNIDRIYTEGGRLSAGGRREYEHGGGSDHDLVRWNVKLV